MKDKEQSKTEAWLKENYHEFTIHCNNTGRSIPFFCNMLEQYHAEKQRTDDRELLIRYDKFMSTHDFNGRLLTPEQAVDEFLNQK